MIKTVTLHKPMASGKGTLATLAQAALLITCLSPGLALAEGAKTQDKLAAMPQLRSQVEEAKALTKLGDQYFQGANVPQDLPAALQYYRQAAALGDPKGMMRLGETMALGQGIEPDVERGLELIRKAADTGDTNALLLLGDLYAQGLAGTSERYRAIGAYETAVKLGRSLALVKLGEIYRDGRIVAQDSKKAVAYFRQAVDAGRTAALVPLGRGLTERKFGRLGSRSEGVVMLKDAVRLGIPDAVLALSDCYLNGQGVAKSPQMAVSILRDALDGGNVEAGRRLVSIYRDGRSKNIPRNRRTAESYLWKIEDRLDPTSVHIERLLMQVSSTIGKSGYGAIQEEFRKIPLAERPGVIRKIRSVNPNTYIYLIQARLRSLGLYGSDVSGQLSRQTVRAIYQYCAGRELREVCRKGPMTGRVTEVLSSAF